VQVFALRFRLLKQETRSGEKQNEVPNMHNFAGFQRPRGRSHVACVGLPSHQLAATASAPSLTCTEMEEFLRKGKIEAQRDIPKGVTLPKRATLEYNGMTHDAAVQTVDIWKAWFTTDRGTELNFAIPGNITWRGMN
jgi:hypothetical protein